MTECGFDWATAAVWVAAAGAVVSSLMVAWVLWRDEKDRNHKGPFDRM